MKEGCCSDSPSLPLAETFIGSTSGNKEKEAELTLGELNSANSASRCGQMGIPTKLGRLGAGWAASRQDSPKPKRPRLLFWNQAGGCPAGPPRTGLPPRLPTALLNLAQPSCSRPGGSSGSPRHWIRPALPQGGRLPLRDRPVTP